MPHGARMLLIGLNSIKQKTKQKKHILDAVKIALKCFPVALQLGDMDAIETLQTKSALKKGGIWRALSVCLPLRSLEPETCLLKGGEGHNCFKVPCSAGISHCFWSCIFCLILKYFMQFGGLAVACHLCSPKHKTWPEQPPSSERGTLRGLSTSFPVVFLCSQ